MDGSRGGTGKKNDKRLHSLHSCKPGSPRDSETPRHIKLFTESAKVLLCSVPSVRSDMTRPSVLKSS
ncbi:hypothetical protein NQZ68_027509 [Dissostichus eleginoides]|nr:hypothetical protein NQZ68_027509 [Dissostichus eleginoides]